MYKSFVTCDDPKGIVDCGIRRRSKSCKGWMEPKIERSKTKKESVAHLSRNVVEGDMVYKGRFEEYRSDHSPFSMDGSSKDSAKEHKKVIKESLVRQNPLPEKNIDLVCDVPSTSSSQSSMICTSNFSSTDSPISSAGSEKKAKGPTLIAKLMGVEEYPSEPLQSTSNQQGPDFDTDMAGARKPPIVIQKKGPGRETLQDILEIMHFQGIQKENSFSSHSLLRNGVPIVLIRPQIIQWSQVERPSAAIFCEERALSKQRSLNSYRAGEMKRINHDAVKDIMETKRLTKSEKLGVRTKQKVSSKMKNFGPLSNQLEKKEVIEKKSAKVQKLAMDSRKPVGKETKSPKTLSKYQNQAKLTPTKTRNSQKQSTTSSSINTSKTLRGTNEQERSPMRREKRINKPRAATVTNEKLGRKGDEKRINLKSEIDLVLVRQSKTTLCQKSVQKGKESSKNQNKEYSNKDCSSVAKIQRDIKSSEEVDDRLGRREGHSNGSTLKALLLNNSAFLHHAKQHFDLNMNVPATEVDSTDAEVRLSLDCAIEIIQYRSFPHSLMTHLPPHNLFRFMRTHISLDQLLDEVCYGIKTLQGYSELAGKNNPTDNIQMLLERDIMHKDMPTTVMWDLEWRNGFSVDDLENIVYDIETRLLTSLVEELFL